MAETIVASNPPKTIKVSLTAGSVSSPQFVTPECAIACVPGAGGSMKAEASWSSVADVLAGTANWHDWNSGTVTAKTVEMLYRATAVRFVATTQDGIGEVSL